MTAQGLVSPGEMGLTLPHEHLIVQGWDHRDPNYQYSAYLEIAPFASSGGGTLVDQTPIGKARDPLFAANLARKAGLQLILGTGFAKGGWLPPEIREMSVHQLSSAMVREITEGIDDTGIRAGVIGEVGIGDPMSRFEQRVLAACAQAQRETGAALFLTFDIGTSRQGYVRALDILEAEGTPLARVVVSPLVPRPDNLELVLELAGRGCYVGFDLFGQERWPLAGDLIRTHPEVQIASVVGFLRYGLMNNILISHNVCHALHLTVNGGLGYSHIIKNVVPKLKTLGVSDKQVDAIMVENPRRLIPLQ